MQGYTQRNTKYTLKLTRKIINKLPKTTTNSDKYGKVWFSSYLTDRTQKVVISDCESHCHTPTCGVPQGSVMGPSLAFTFYIAPLGVRLCLTFEAKISVFKRG